MTTKQTSEKRSNDRKRGVVKATYADFEMDTYHHAHLIDYSFGGAKLEMKEALRPGTTVFFQINENPRQAVKAMEEDQIVPAEVVWCRPTAGSGEYGYSTGLKFIA